MNSPPTVAVLVPIHDKPEEVLMAVLQAAHRTGPMIVVLDRYQGSAMIEVAPEDVDFVRLEGRPGWRSPCIAANAGLAKVAADVTVYNPSDVVQATGNLKVVRDHFLVHPRSVLFGRVIESNPEMCKGAGHAGPVLQGSDNTRPMTFLTAYPTEALRAAGGWDEAFQLGVCYEDDDLAARLWKHGLDFVFDDRFSGIHQSHERVFDGKNATQGYWTDYRVGLNRTLMVNKHGRESAIGVVMHSKPQVIKLPGRVEWNQRLETIGCDSGRPGGI
jgi:hypothetical protein